MMLEKGKYVSRISVQFGRDDLKLAGKLFLPQTAQPLPAAILCHGLASGQKTVESSAQTLASRGVAALTFDFRGHGLSQGVFDGDAAADIIEAWQWLARQAEVDSLHIALVGHSMGARSALLAAPKIDPLHALVLLSCPTDPEMKAEPDPAARARYWEGQELPIKQYPRDGILPWVQGMRGVLAWAWMYLQNYRLHIDWQKYFENLANVKTSATLPDLGSYPKLFVYCQGDKYIPRHAALEFFENVPQPKELLMARDGYHAAPLSSRSLRNTWIDWLVARLL